MKPIVLACGLALAALFATPASAAVLDCDELLDKIAKRLESKKITDYQLKAVPVAEKHPGKEVGRCQRGSMKVMLERGKPAEHAAGE